MLLTTGLLYLAMREVWRWPVVLAGAVAGFFLVVDLAFFGSNLLKVPDGGWVPAHAWPCWSTARCGSGIRASRRSAPVSARRRSRSTPFFEGLAQGRHRAARGDGDLPLSCPRRDAAADGLARAAEPLSLRRRADHHHRHGADAAGRRSPTASRSPRERDKVWRVLIHSGFMERLGLDDLLPALKSPGLRRRHVEGGLLRRPRDDRPRPGRQARPQQMGREDLRRDGAQPGAPHRRARPAERPGWSRSAGISSCRARLFTGPRQIPARSARIATARHRDTPVDPSRPLKSAIGGTSWTGGMRRH